MGALHPHRGAGVRRRSRGTTLEKYQPPSSRRGGLVGRDNSLSDDVSWVIVPGSTPRSALVPDGHPLLRSIWPREDADGHHRGFATRPVRSTSPHDPRLLQLQAINALGMTHVPAGGHLAVASAVGVAALSSRVWFLRTLVVMEHQGARPVVVAHRRAGHNGCRPISRGCTQPRERRHDRSVSSQRACAEPTRGKSAHATGGHAR